MNIIQLNHKMDILNHLYEDYNNNIPEFNKISDELKDDFLIYLKQNPYNTTIRLKLFLLIYNYFNDILTSIECLEDILSYDPQNIIATLLLAYVYAHYKWVDEKLFLKLSSLETDNNEILSMIEYAKGWHYKFKKNKLLLEECLLKSIEFCNRHVWNYVRLGKILIKKGLMESGYKYLLSGLENIEYVYSDKHPYPDIFDIDEFFNERFKGVHISQNNYEIILESFDQKSPWIMGDFRNAGNESGEH